MADARVSTPIMSDDDEGYVVGESYYYATGRHAEAYATRTVRCGCVLCFARRVGAVLRAEGTDPS